MGNCTVRICAEPVHDEVDVIDNNMTRWIVLTIQGDLDGDFTVEILDAVELANSFMKAKGDLHWNANADLNNDDLLDISDAIVLGLHFQEHYHKPSRARCAECLLEIC